jgi:hypothetical protein
VERLRESLEIVQAELKDRIFKVCSKQRGIESDRQAELRLRQENDIG